jgi:hypothetical protein
MAARGDLIRVTPEYLLQAEVSIEDLHRLVKRTLSMPSYWEVMTRLLKLKRTVFFVDLLSISRVLCSSEFSRSLFKSNTSVCVSLMNKVIKVSAYLLTLRLLTHEDIRTAIFVHDMLSRKNNHKFPADKALILKAMRAMNKVMAEKLIEEWLVEVDRQLVDPAYISAYEFLFLVANAKDRLALLDRLPRCERSIVPNKKSRLFTIDSAAKTKMTPDSIMQDSLNHEVDMQKNFTRPEVDDLRPLKYAEERLRALENSLLPGSHEWISNGLDLKMHDELQSVIEEGSRYCTRKKSIFTSDSIRKRVIDVMGVSLRPNTTVDERLRKQKSLGGKKMLAHRSFMLSDPFCN